MDTTTNDVRDPAAAFSADEMEHAREWGTLGPAYEGARKAAEKVMAGFEAEHFKPLIDKLAGDFADRLWGDLETSLLSDVELNLQGSVWRMVDATVNALLSGERWAVERYALRGERYSEAEKVRAAIAKHCGDEIAAKRIAALEAEVADLKARIEDVRRYG